MPSRSSLPRPDHPVNVGVVGAGAMGAHHAETLARRVPGARLAGVADPLPGLAQRVAASLGCDRWTTDLHALLAEPELHAVVIATPTRFHAEAIAAAAQAGKAIFCEKPLANDLAEADRALAAVRAAGVLFQVGFQRRFDRGYRAAHDLARSGALGSVQLLRSVTRDPELTDPARAPAWAVFRETLIHDFDVLRFLNPGAEPVEVFAMADALVLPDWKARGLLDTATVLVRFDNGALATADASFQAVYGYDVRAEVFGSAGLATVGDGRASSLVHHDRQGEHVARVRWFVDLFGEAYTAELAHFVACVRTGEAPACSGADGRAALSMALAAIRSVESGQPTRISEVTGG